VYAEFGKHRIRTFVYHDILPQSQFEPNHVSNTHVYYSLQNIETARDVNSNLTLVLFYICRLKRPDSEKVISRIKNSRDLKSYKKLAYIFHVLSKAFRSCTALASTFGTAIIIISLYFVLGNMIPLFERVLGFAGLIMFGPSSIFAWIAAGLFHEKCKTVIWRLNRSRFPSPWESRSAMALTPFRLYVGNYFYVKADQVLIFSDTVANHTVSLMLTYPSKNFF